MIAKIKMIALGAALMLAAATVQANAQNASPQLELLLLGGPTAAFCCSGYDTDASTGVGCYATPAGPSSITACNGAYFECPAADFFCSPTAVKAAVAGQGSSGSVENCGCGNGPNIF
jgi:hypothetical protein